MKDHEQLEVLRLQKQAWCQRELWIFIVSLET
jgi:hypothetical protein